jgi:UDP-N-acetyl-D-galactosamine dehydrogenase
MITESTLDKAVVCVVGLGYAGLPLAEAFSKNLKVIGFDIDTGKIEKLGRGNSSKNLTFTSNPAELNGADFIIICVPTPVTDSKEPDLSFVEKAAETTGKNMKKGCVVILESTVYPGVTEEIVKASLEKSGLKCGPDFKIGYSPERINPGDTEHTINTVVKVVSGMDEETTQLIAGLYGKITSRIHIVPDIRTAEAAKVIENIQRDLNIALINELSIIFKKMGMNSRDVFDAAATKWNFFRFNPGLVGGHCIPVDPYYLVYKAREFGLHPQVILAGRSINDYVPEYVAEMTVKALNNVSKVINGSRVLIMGLTYKEDVPDTRQNPVKGIIKELRDYGIEVLGYDPLLENTDIETEFEIKSPGSLEELKKEKVDGVVITVAHSSFKKLKLEELKEIQNSSPVLIDIRGVFNAGEAIKAGFYYDSL